MFEIVIQIKDGEKLKDSMIIEWKNYRFIFSEIYWD